MNTVIYPQMGADCSSDSFKPSVIIHATLETRRLSKINALQIGPRDLSHSSFLSALIGVDLRIVFPSFAFIRVHSRTNISGPIRQAQMIPPVRRIKVERGAQWDDAAWIDIRMAAEIVLLDMVHIDRFGHAGHLIELA